MSALGLQSGEIAHHTHAASNVVAARRGGIPRIVLCRNPDDAANSMRVRHPHMHPALAYRSIASFFKPLAPGAAFGDFILPFETATDVVGLTQFIAARFDQVARFDEQHVAAQVRSVAGLDYSGDPRMGVGLPVLDRHPPSGLAAVKDEVWRGRAWEALRRYRTRPDAI